MANWSADASLAVGVQGLPYVLPFSLGPNTSASQNFLAGSTQAVTVPGMEQSTVTFDAAGAGANSGAGTTTSLSWSHTAAAGADVFAFVLRGGSTTTATYDGAAMDYVGAVSLNNDANNGVIYVFRKANVAAGTKTVAITFGSATYCSAASVSYLNVGAVTTKSVYAAAALTASQTVSGASYGMVINAIGQYCGGVDTFVSSSGGTQRYQGMGSAKYMNLVVQDTTSTGSTTFSSTVTATNTVSGSISLVLSPPPSTQASARQVQLLSTSSMSQGNAYSITWSHTIESNASLLVVAWHGLSSSFSPTCTVNGQAMTAVTGITYNASNPIGWVGFFYYVNPPSGTQSIVISGGGTGAWMNVTSLTFKDSKVVGTVSTANGASVTPTAGANDFLLNIIGGWINGWGGFTGYNQTVVYDNPAASTQAAMVGYARGPTATFGVSSLIANYGGYGNAVLPIKPLTDHSVDANLAVTVTNTPARPSVNAPYVDAIGGGGVGGALSFTHTVGSRANLLLVAVNNSVYNAGSPTVYCDGVAMTNLGAWNYGYVALYNYSYLTWYALWNPTPGTRTITTSASGTSSANSISIANAGGIGTKTSNAAGVAIAGLPDQLMINMFGGWSSAAGQGYTGYSPAAGLLWDSTTLNDSMPTVIGDWIDPSGTTTFTATNHAGNATGASVLPIGVARQANASLDVTATTTASASVNAVNYDSTGAGASANGGTLTWSHTIGANANCLIVACTTNTYAYNMPTVRVGSTYLKCLGINYFDVSNSVFTMIFGLMNPPTGVQTLTMTGMTNYTAANSVAYRNVSGFSTPVYSKGSGTSITLTDPGVEAGMVVQAFGSRAPSALTGYNQWLRSNIRDPSLSYPLLIGDAAGAAGLTFTATNPDTSSWGGTGITLLPMSAAPTGIQYDGMGIGSCMTGYASVSFSHVATAGACVILDMAIDRNETITAVQYGGQNMSLLGSARFTGYSGNAGIWRYVLPSAPGGLSTVTATLSANSYFAANTMAFTGVGTISAATTTFGNNSVPSQTVSYTANTLTVESIGVYAHVLGTLSGGTNLYNYSNASISLVMNEATATDTFTAGLTGVNWGAISNVLYGTNDVSLAITASQAADTNVGHPWSADSSLAITTVPTSDSLRNAIVAALQAITVTETQDSLRNAIVDSSQTITSTFSPVFLRNVNVDSATQAITAGKVGQEVVAFDSVGVGATGSGTPKTITWNHTITASANYVVMAVSLLLNGTPTPATLTALVGSTPMTYLGGNLAYAPLGGGFYAIMLYGMANPPTGTQTMSVGSASLATYLAANTVAYRNVAEVSPIYTMGGAASTSLSQGPINAESNQMIVQAFAQNQNVALTAYNQTQRYNVSGAANVNASLLVGDAIGGSPVTFTATSPASGAYGGAAIGLIATPSSLRNANVDSSQVITETSSSTGTRNAIVNASQALSAVPDSYPIANFKVSSSGVITATTTNVGSYGAVGNTSLALTSTETGTGSYGAVGNSTLAISHSTVRFDNATWGTAYGTYGGCPWTHTATAGATVFVHAASTEGIYNVQYGGVVMTAGYGGWYLTNVPGGASTVWINTPPATRVTAIAVSYVGMVTYGAVTTGTPQTVSCNPGEMIVQLSSASGGTSTGGTTRIQVSDGQYYGWTAADSSTSTTFTISAGTAYVFVLSPRPLPVLAASANVSQVITVGDSEVLKWAAKFDAPLALTASAPALENESAVAATPLPLTATVTAAATKNLFVDSSTQTITTTLTADMLRNANTNSEAGAIATITSVADRNAIVDSSEAVTAIGTSVMKWHAYFDVSESATATTSVTATRVAKVDALLAITADPSATPHIDHPATSTLVVTATKSAGVNADFVADSSMLVSTSSSVTALRSIYFDAELVITETATSRVKWALKAQASQVITVDPSGTATRNARVNASLLASLGQEDYMFQTESFDVPLNVIADLTAVLNVATTLDSPTLDVLADLTGTIHRLVFADSDPIDITVEIPPSEFLLGHFAEAIVSVDNTFDSSVLFDAVCNVPLEISADASVVINQDGLIDTDLQIEAVFVSSVVMDALIDAYLNADTDLAAEGIRGQSVNAEQEVTLTITEEVKWHIVMQALLDVPVTTTVDTQSGQVSSNFFVFYL